MSKSQVLLRTIISIGIGVFAFLLIVSIVDYASLSKLILTFIKDLKPGR